MNIIKKFDSLWKDRILSNNNNMILRSGKNTLFHSVNIRIDFDEASRAWRKNKVSRSCGMFVYL